VERSLLASIVALPPAVTLAAQVAAFELHRSPPSTLSTFVLLTLPALLPGGIGWIRVWALRQTVLELKLEVAALPPGRSGDPPGCRQCAAPLDAAPAAISVTCRYCGADSVVAGLPPAAELKHRALVFENARGGIRGAQAAPPAPDARARGALARGARHVPAPGDRAEDHGVIRSRANSTSVIDRGLPASSIGVDSKRAHAVDSAFWMRSRSARIGTPCGNCEKLPNSSSIRSDAARASSTP
jgi:hypothetical protein